MRDAWWSLLYEPNLCPGFTYLYLLRGNKNWAVRLWIMVPFLTDYWSFVKQGCVPETEYTKPITSEKYWCEKTEYNAIRILYFKFQIYSVVFKVPATNHTTFLALFYRLVFMKAYCNTGTDIRMWYMTTCKFHSSKQQLTTFYSMECNPAQYHIFWLHDLKHWTKCGSVQPWEKEQGKWGKSNFIIR